MSVLKDLESIRNVVETTRISEKEKRETRIDFDEKHVRQSVVNSREDLIFLCAASGFFFYYI